MINGSVGSILDEDSLSEIDCGISPTNNSTTPTQREVREISLAKQPLLTCLVDAATGTSANVCAKPFPQPARTQTEHEVRLEAEQQRGCRQGEYIR